MFVCLTRSTFAYSICVIKNFDVNLDAKNRTKNFDFILSFGGRWELSMKTASETKSERYSGQKNLGALT